MKKDKMPRWTEHEDKALRKVVNRHTKEGKFRADLVAPDKWPKGRTITACCQRVRHLYNLPTKGVEAARAMEPARAHLEVVSYCWGLITKTRTR